MAAFWLTFKPRGPAAPRGWPQGDMTNLVQRFEENPVGTTQWWRNRSRRAARNGDRVFLFKQGEDPRGIFGVGSIIGGPELRGEAWCSLIRFDRLVDPSQRFLLELKDIEDIVPPGNINAAASGFRVPEGIVPELERRLATAVPDIRAFDPASSEDEIQRAFRAIRIRRGQPAFRAALLEAYAGQCAVTGCAVVDVLEAAHIAPYSDNPINHLSNGLLLRADIHTLFDCGLIAVDPDTKQVVVAAALRSSSYGEIAGIVLQGPQNEAHRPGKQFLQDRFTRFQASQ